MLETDERVVGDMIAAGPPRVLVFLNFSRDQLDRHHEIKALGRAWRNALEKAGDEGPVIVANAITLALASFILVMKLRFGR